MANVNVSILLNFLSIFTCGITSRSCYREKEENKTHINYQEYQLNLFFFCLFFFAAIMNETHSRIEWPYTSKASLSECILIRSLSLLSSLRRLRSLAEIPLLRLLVVGGAPRFRLLACFGLLSLPLLSLSSPTFEKRQNEHD